MQFRDVLCEAVKKTGRCDLIRWVYPSIATNPLMGGARQLATNRVHVRHVAEGVTDWPPTSEEMDAELASMEAEGIDVTSARTCRRCGGEVCS